MQENATNSLLLRLPPEIRNKIYEFALPSDKSIVLHGGNELSDKHLRDLRKGYSLSLPQVCRQVYSETAFAVGTRIIQSVDAANALDDKVYANNTFLFRAGVDEAYDWFKSRNYAQLNAIRAFRIQLFLKGSVSRKSAVQSQALKDLVNLQWRKVVYSNGDAELQFGDFRAGGWGIERYRRITQIYDSSIEAEPYLMTRYEG